MAITGLNPIAAGAKFTATPMVDAFRATDRPGLVYASVTFGVYTAALTNAKKWRQATMANQWHIGHLDKRFIGHLRDLTHSLQVHCQSHLHDGSICGRDITYEYQQTKAKGQILSICGTCGGHIDGSWECRGRAASPHKPHVNAVNALICSARHGGRFCGVPAPWIKVSEYCVGCLHSKGLDTIAASRLPRGTVNEVEKETLKCLDGHLHRPVCPICQKPDCLSENAVIDALSRSRLVYNSSELTCFQQAGNADWACCPSCDYPMVAPKLKAPEYCPRCGYIAYTCPQCAPKDPFRLVKQAELCFQQPDPANPATCPVHSCDCTR